MDESLMLRLIKEKYDELQEEIWRVSEEIAMLCGEIGELQEEQGPYEEILRSNNVLLEDGPDNEWNQFWLDKWKEDPESS